MNIEFDLNAYFFFVFEKVNVLKYRYYTVFKKIFYNIFITSSPMINQITYNKTQKSCRSTLYTYQPIIYVGQVRSYLKIWFWHHINKLIYIFLDVYVFKIVQCLTIDTFQQPTDFNFLFQYMNNLRILNIEFPLCQ